MDDRFIATPLAVRQIDQAFPIVQSVQPKLPIDDWRRFAVNLQALGGRRAGIMTAQRRGYIHGLFSYSVEPHIHHHRLLVVDNFVALDLFDPGGVTEVLLASMEALADELRCSAIHTNLPHSDAYAPSYRHWLVDRFTDAGHHAENLLFCKDLHATAEKAVGEAEATAQPSAKRGSGSKGGDGGRRVVRVRFGGNE